MIAKRYILAGVVLATAISGDVMAGLKLSHATNCVVKYPRTTDHHYSASWLAADEDATIYCPITRVPYHDLDYIRINFESIHSTVAPGNLDLAHQTCKLYARDEDGGSASSSEKSITVPQAASGSIEWTGSDLNESSNRSYVILCDVEAGTTVASVRISEL